MSGKLSEIRNVIISMMGHEKQDHKIKTSMESIMPLITEILNQNKNASIATIKDLKQLRDYIIAMMGHEAQGHDIERMLKHALDIVNRTLKKVP